VFDNLRERVVASACKAGKQAEGMKNAESDVAYVEVDAAFSGEPVERLEESNSCHNMYLHVTQCRDHVKLPARPNTTWNCHIEHV